MKELRNYLKRILRKSQGTLKPFHRPKTEDSIFSCSSRPRGESRRVSLVDGDKTDSIGVCCLDDFPNTYGTNIAAF